MVCWWITWDNSSEVLNTVRNMADTPPVLVANRRFEDPGNRRNNNVSRSRRGNRNYSHGSYAFSHHPLQIAHEKHSNSHYGRFQNAIKHCYVIQGLETGQVTWEWENQVKERCSLHLTKDHRKLCPLLLGRKIPAATHPKDSHIFWDSTVPLYFNTLTSGILKV